VVTQHGLETHIDHEAGDQQLNPFQYPRASMVVVFSGEWVFSQEKRLPHAAIRAMKDPGYSLSDDFLSRASWHDDSSWAATNVINLNCVLHI